VAAAETFAGSVGVQVGATSIADVNGSATADLNVGLAVLSGHSGFGGSITDNRSLYVLSPFQTSPLTANYGIFLEDQTLSSGESWALYSEGGRSFFADPVGIGTSDPQSALQVAGYIQLDLTAGAPPAADCNEATERGRMQVDSSAGVLYVCVDSGWMAK